MKQVAILGNGQLGGMMKEAGMALGIPVTLLDIEGDTMPSPGHIVTAEREHWIPNDFTKALVQHPNWLNAKAMEILPDRRTQKQLLDQLGVPTAPWTIPDPSQGAQALIDKLGSLVFVKSARGGYDGRGQARLRSGADVLPDWAGEAIAEQGIAFQQEVSLVSARGRDGQVVHYRLTRNHHHEGILQFSISLGDTSPDLQQQAETHMRKVLEALDYVGVMAIEYFDAGGKLLVNEIAPRVHNSGHWTQAGASVSQFEMHLRAVCGLPLVSPVQEGHAAMINLIGVAFDPSWLAHPAAEVHWYAKDLRPGRKMGHINLRANDKATLAQWLQNFPLPEHYSEGRAWTQQQLA